MEPYYWKTSLQCLLYFLLPPAARDALAKALYDRIFRWVVNRINQLLAPTAADTVGSAEVGILDIFGFEKFERNSFEQMCINVANEQLQYFFIEHVFLLEEEEYRREGVASLGVQFRDNKALLVSVCASSSLPYSHLSLFFLLRSYFSLNLWGCTHCWMSSATSLAPQTTPSSPNCLRP